MVQKQRTIWPVLTLLFLSPVIGELLSGSALPVEIFHPFMLLVLCILYGGGAILFRELRVRWDPLPGNLRLEGGFAHLLAGSFRDNAPLSNGQGDSTFLYTQATVRF